MTTRFPRIRVDLTRLGLGKVQLSTRAKTRREHDRRVVLFDELVADSQIGVITALLEKRVAWEELVDARRRHELSGKHALANVDLARPLFGPEGAIEQTLPRMGRAKATRARYGDSGAALERQKVVAWPREPMRVRDLVDIDWTTMADGWPNSASDWNNVVRFVSAFLTQYLGHKHHVFRLELMPKLSKLAEESRVPDLSPALFRRILEQAPEYVRPCYVTLLLTGMRDRSEYLRCTEEHKLPVTKQIKVPGTKTKKAKAPIAVDPDWWDVVDSAIPAPVGYKALHKHWTRACVAVGAGRYVPTGEKRRVRVKLKPGHRYSVGEQLAYRVVDVTEYSGLRMHDLRHALGQWAHDAGEPLSRIKEMLRHSTLAMTERYARTGATQAVAKTVGALLREAK